MSPESRAFMDATVEVAECVRGAPRLAHRSAHAELIAVSVDEFGTVVLPGAVSGRFDHAHRLRA